MRWRYLPGSCGRTTHRGSWPSVTIRGCTTAKVQSGSTKTLHKAIQRIHKKTLGRHELKRPLTFIKGRSRERRVENSVEQDGSGLRRGGKERDSSEYSLHGDGQRQATVDPQSNQSKKPLGAVAFAPFYCRALCRRLLLYIGEIVLNSSRRCHRTRAVPRIL